MNDLFKEEKLEVDLPYNDDSHIQLDPKVEYMQNNILTKDIENETPDLKKSFSR